MDTLEYEPASDATLHQSHHSGLPDVDQLVQTGSALGPSGWRPIQGDLDDAYRWIDVAQANRDRLREDVVADPQNGAVSTSRDHGAGLQMSGSTGERTGWGSTSPTRSNTGGGWGGGFGSGSTSSHWQETRTSNDHSATAVRASDDEGWGQVGGLDDAHVEEWKTHETLGWTWNNNQESGTGVDLSGSILTNFDAPVSRLDLPCVH